MLTTQTSPTSSITATNSAETKARSLGATVVFHRHYTKANSFPTHGALMLFADWLKSLSYDVDLDLKLGEVKYTTPIAVSKVVILNNHRA